MPEATSVILREPRGPVTLHHAPLPDPSPCEVLLRMDACGLRESGLTAGQSVAIYGFGSLDHLALQIARHRGRASLSSIPPPKRWAPHVAGAEIVQQVTAY